MSAVAADNPTLFPAAPGTADARRIDELGRIILAYSEITEKLQQSHERLEQTVATLRDELGEKSRMLERKNRLAAIGEMAAGIAHEIRNPLGAIKLYASSLARDVAAQPGALGTVRKLRDCVQRLESVVEQVLDFSGEMRASVVEADLGTLIDEVIGLAAHALTDRPVQTRVVGPRPMRVEVDPILLGQAVLNLVLNAADAMEQGGRIEIEYGPLADEGWQFYLVVADTGPGIPAQLMDRIFNPFFTTRATGTGLGLAIVHRVVEAHEGSVTAGNREAGGARFEIRI